MLVMLSSNRKKELLVGYFCSSCLFSWKSCRLRFDPWGVNVATHSSTYHGRRTVIYDLRSISFDSILLHKAPLRYIRHGKKTLAYDLRSRPCTASEDLLSIYLSRKAVRRWSLKISVHLPLLIVAPGGQNEQVVISDCIGQQDQSAHLPGAVCKGHYKQVG